MSSKNKNNSEIETINEDDNDETNDNSEIDNDETSVNEDSESSSDIEDDDCDYSNIIPKFNQFDKKEIFLEGDNRITNKFLTKYEYVRLIEDRATQLNLESKPMIKNADGLTSREIAMEEIKQKVIPLKIIRNLPNGLKEKWKISELTLKQSYI